MVPFASIIVPTYNQEAYLGQALDSILAQTDRDWEAIVVNDGSTDGTAAIADAYAARDPRFRVVHKANGGVASALNEGLSRARGRWVHWLSSDDMFEPTKLKINRQWIERHPTAKFFFSYFTLLRQTTGEREKRELWGPVPDPEHQILTLFYRNPISGITICIDREAWLETGCFDERFYYAQDYHQWLRLLERHQGVFIPEWTVISRNHAEQGSETFPDACYFDTAKAAITFLNQHAFPRLVPRSDLQDPKRAVAAVSAALNYAADESSFLYALGPTPALILRILEWAYGEHAHPSVLDIVRERIIAEALKPGDDAFRWMWQTLAAAVSQRNPSFVYDPSDHLQLAQSLYVTLLKTSPSRAEALATYLRRFDRVEVGPTSDPSAAPMAIAINAAIDLPLEALESLRSGAVALAAQGHRPALIVPQAESYRWAGGVARIRSGSHDIDTLPWLAGAGLGVGVGRSVSAWLSTRNRYDLAASAAAQLEEVVADTLHHVSASTGGQPVRPVVILQRVLRGGGAERVVREIASHLDRTRYRPIVATLFEEGFDPHYPADIEVVNIRRLLFEQVNAPAAPIAVEAQATSAAPRALGRKARLRAWLVSQIKRNPAAKRAALSARNLIHGLRYGLRSLVVTSVIRSLAIARKISRRFLGPLSPSPITGMAVLNQAAGSATNKLPFELRHSALHQSLDNHWPAGEGLRLLMSQLGPDAGLITVMEEATVAAWLAQRAGKIPYIASLHTVESVYLPQMYPDPVRCELESWIFTNACRGAHAVVFPTHGCAEDLRSYAGVSENALQIIGNPIDCARVRKDSFAVCQTLRRDPGEVLFVTVGRLDAKKGQRAVLEAFAHHRRENPDARLVVVGDGPERPALLQLRAQLNLDEHVDFLGDVANPFPIVRQADALVLGSQFEAFALVLVEAMICGVPVLSFDCPFGPGEVLKAGHCGLLVPLDDIDGLGAAMSRIAKDETLRRELIERGYERALDFDVSVVTRRWEELIEHVFDRRGAAT
uniref:Glycosyltransferase n=1 Tax=Bosea sp. NBC_00436 TaxID=2969620 RepID=A0A9E8CU35_9HYPH